MKLTFIEECREWYKMWSNWLAVAAGAAAVWIVDNPTVVLEYAAALPEGIRQVVTFFVVAGIPIAVRIAKQPNLTKGSSDV